MDNETFWNKNRLNRVAIAVAVALIIALPLGFIADTQGSSLLKRGDFPGFFVLGYILTHHSPEQLYDPQLQRSIENALWPSFDGGFYMSAYPPYTALLLKPLAQFSPAVAQLIFLAVMCSSLVGTLYLLHQLNSTLKNRTIAIGIFSLLFAPLFYGLFGAQNTPLSMLLYAVMLYGVSKRTRSGDIMAGLAIGAWFFKPQYGLFAFAISLFLRRPVITTAALFPISLYTLLGIYVLDISWPLTWWSAAGQFGDQNLWSNAPTMVSLASATKIALHTFGIAQDSTLLLSASIIVNTCMLGLLLWYCLKVWQEPNSQRSNLLCLFLGPVLLLATPQALFYDLGIALVSLFAALDFRKDLTINGYLAFCFLLFPITYWREELVIPLFPMVALGMLYVVSKDTWRRSAPLI